MSNKQSRPDALVGRKLPKHALWEQLQSRAHPLALEFCSAFFNNEMTYAKAKKWLEGYGIKVSVTALQGFYNSLDMRLRFAALQAEESAETAKSELPADIEEATRQRIAQHKFELSFMNLSEQHRLQLIQLQQSQDAMKGNYELKKAKLDLDRIKIQRQVVKNFLDWYADEEAKKIASSNLPTAEKTERLGQRLFGDLWQ